MGKQLIIKGADFSENAIDNISPSGLIFKDLLVSDGTAFIDTGIVLANTDVLEITSKYIAKPNVTNALWGWRNSDSSASTNGNVMCIWNAAFDSFSKLVVGSSTGDIPAGYNFLNLRKVTINFQNNTVFLDNTNLSSTYSGTIVYALGTISLGLFGFNTSSGVIGTGNVCAIGGCKITRNGSVILDYRPCIKDGVSGMYNMVTNEFVGPTSGGTFTAIDE